MKKCFLEYGFTKKMRTEYGPQCRSEFASFCHQTMIKEDSFIDVAAMDLQKVTEEV